MTLNIIRTEGWAHHAAWTQPLPVRNLREGWVEAVDVVWGWAGVTTQQLASIFTHSAKLHVVILFLPWSLFLLLVLIFGLPLDTLFLLSDTGMRQRVKFYRFEFTHLVDCKWKLTLFGLFMRKTTLTYWDCESKRLRDHSFVVIVINFAQYICEKREWAFKHCLVKINKTERLDRFIL